MNYDSSPAEEPTAVDSRMEAMQRYVDLDGRLSSAQRDLDRRMKEIKILAEKRAAALDGLQKLLGLAVSEEQ